MNASSTASDRAGPAPGHAAPASSPAESQALADRFMAKWKGLCGDDAALEGAFAWGRAVGRVVGTRREALEACERQVQARELARRNPFPGLRPDTFAAKHSSLVAALQALHVDVGSDAEPQALKLTSAYDFVAQAHVERRDSAGRLRSRLLAAEAEAKSTISAQLHPDEIARIAEDAETTHPSLSRFLRELYVESLCEVVAASGARERTGVPATHFLAKNQRIKQAGMSSAALVDAFESVARVDMHDARGDIVGLGLSTFAFGGDIACLGGGTSQALPLKQSIDDRGGDAYCIARDPVRGGISGVVTSGDIEQSAGSRRNSGAMQAAHAARLLAMRLPLLLDDRDFEHWRGSDRQVALDRFRVAASSALERVHVDAIAAAVAQAGGSRRAEAHVSVSCVGFRLQSLPDDGALLTAVGLGAVMLISYDDRTRRWATVVPAVYRRDPAHAEGGVAERQDTLDSALRLPRVHVDVLSQDDVDHLTYFAFTSGFVEGAERLGLVEETIEAGIDGEFRVLRLDPARIGRQAATEQDSTRERLAACRRVAIDGVVDAFMEDLVACACDEGKVPSDFGGDVAGVGGRARALVRFSVHPQPLLVAAR